MENPIYNKLKLYEGKKLIATQSPAGQWLDYTLLEITPGYIKTALIVRENMTNPLKQIHGGIITLIMDEICGVAFYSLGLNNFYTTVNLQTDFLYAANEGETIFANAKVVRAGKKIGNVQGEIFNEEGVCLARATTNLVNTGHTRFELTNDSPK